MFGHNARLPIDVMYASDNQGRNTLLPEYVRTLQATFAEVFECVRANISKHQERQKETYDKRIHGSPHQPGSLVWLFNPVVPRGGSRKFHKPWTGPYRVITRLSDNTYKIKAVQKPHRLKVVHFDRLKCCTPNVRIPETSHPHPRSVDVTPQPPVGTNVQVVDNDCEILDATVPVPPATVIEPPLYPSHDNRHPPTRYEDYIRH